MNSLRDPRGTGALGPLPLTLALVAFVAAGASCSEADATETPSPTATTPSGGSDPGGVTALPKDVAAPQAIRDLIAAVTPLPAEATAGARNDWFGNRKDTLERLRAAGEEIGREALEAYYDRKQGLTEVRVGLLDVAAHGVPNETKDILVELVTEFGEDLMLRTAACKFLGQTSPAAAVELLEPILLERRHTRTYPPEDQMLAAWLIAMRSLDRDPSEVLAAMATNLNEYPEARHLAVRELAGTESARATEALRQLLVESGANTYIRRLAAQSLYKTIPLEDFCTELNSIGSREADVDFQLFVANMLERYCR